MLRTLAVCLLASSVIAKGLPKEKGLGKLAIVTNFVGRDARYKAVQKLAKARGAKVYRFKEGKLAAVRGRLAGAGVEFVAIAVTPETIDINFHYDVLELCRNLDDDPMPDFCFGYLSAREGDDLARMVERILEKEARPPEKPTAKVIALTGTGAQLAGLDFALHFGHGQAWRVDKGMTGVEVGKLELQRAPVIWSGACFNGVFSRSYHKCAYQPIFMRPTTIKPEHVMTLNWVHAGVSGYFAALEGDRGEMAMAEWDYFREKACSLGEVMTYQYRLAFTSLPADFAGFPRYINGRKKRTRFYDVMLRGMVSRLLLSDPACRPLRTPLATPVHATTVGTADGSLTITIKLLRWTPGHHLNYLPRSGKGIFDARVYERVRVDHKGKLGEPTITVDSGPRAVELSRWRVREELWGGQRYLNLQVEAPTGSFRKNTIVTFVFPAK